MFRRCISRTGLFVLLVGFAMLLTGCEQVSQIAEDVKAKAENLSSSAPAEEVTSEDSTATAVPGTDTSSSPASTNPSDPATSIIPSIPTLPVVPVDPDKVVASFLQTNPRERRDEDFLALADLPADALDAIGDVVIASEHVTPQGLDVLQKCAQLKRLELTEMTLSDEMLASVAQLMQLESLSLANSKFSDDGLQQLETLKQLKELNLGGSTVTDAGVVLVPLLPELEVLNLSHTQVTGVTLQNKPKLEHLRILDLTKSQVVYLVYFKGLVNLEELLALELPIDDRHLRFAGGWPNLKKLVLSFSNISDAGFKATFSSSKQLEHVELRATKIGNPTLGVLSKCENLQFLLATDTGVDINAGAALKKILPNAEISW